MEEGVKSLRELRVSKLLSQRALAVEAGVSPQTIFQTEVGRVSPSLIIMRRICTALDVEPKDVTEFVAAMASKSKAE